MTPAEIEAEKEEKARRGAAIMCLECADARLEKTRRSFKSKDVADARTYVAMALTILRAECERPRRRGEV